MADEENPIDVNALAAMGSKRLATLLAEAAMTNSSMRRRLQLELFAQKDNVPEVIRRWISELREQTSFLGAEEVGQLARELDDIRATIVSDVSRAAPELAPDLMWQLFTLAGSVYDRTTEEGWEVGQVFDQACADLVKVSVDAEVEPKLFAAKVVSAISSDGYGEYSVLIPAIASAQPWASTYVSELKVLLLRLLDEPPGPSGRRNGEVSHVLRRALRELGFPTTT
ncbi:MAG TPA: hypothetical protein VF446_11045 [Trinickia sp.]